ncbi:ankyrin-2-like [Telopea speciosissima]|uniref:ankyrin-2-like n=1 Tax=Telopea speciosissima TaxID=54955 RepID=UPI001CC54A58|nr:ankyrin-2-like [Telopea speciosissima]
MTSVIQVSAEPKIAGVGEDTEKHIIEECKNMAHSTESMKEPLKESSHKGEIMKQHEEEVHKGLGIECEVHKGLGIECEVLDKFSTGENTEREKVVEKNAIKGCQEETVIESCQADEVTERLEAAGAGREPKRIISEEYGAVTDTCKLSAVGATVKESSEEDEKEAEKLKEEVKLTDSEVRTSKDMEDTNTNADATGVTEALREEMLQKEHSQKFVVYDEQVKEKDLEEAVNKNERFEAASARTSQEVAQEEKQVVDGSNLASEEKSTITTETSWTTLHDVDVKGVKLEEVPNPSDNETLKKTEVVGQEVETMNKEASNKKLSYDVEEVKGLDHSQEDEIEGKKSSEEPELELGEHVHEKSRGTTDQNQEALPFMADSMGGSLKIDVTDIIEACIKDASTDNAPTKQDIEEGGFDGVPLKGQEKSSLTGGMETGPTIVNPSERTEEKKQEGVDNPEDNNTDSLTKAEESLKTQNGEEIINNNEGTNEMFHIPLAGFITEDTSLDKPEQESGNIEQLSQETVNSNETLNGENPGENENPNDDVEIPLVTEETRLDKSEHEPGNLEEISSSELEEKSQETNDSNEKMKDEKPFEYELSDTEDLESPLVTPATEGSHFQQQDEPEKIEEASEAESVYIEKDKCNEAESQDKILETAESTISEKAQDDENIETKLDASSIKDEEGLQGESKELVFPLKNAPIEEKDDKGSSVTEIRDNIEVTEIIEAEENCRWEVPKDMEASVHSLQTDDTEEEKLEKSLDMVSEVVEPAASNAEAERSTTEKEEESVKRESFNEESKEGNINWDDEARGHKMPKDENLGAVDQSQERETMEVVSPNMEMDSLLSAHSLVEGAIQEACEQQEKVSNLEVDEQVHEENRNALVDDNQIEEEFRARENMDSTILEKETIDGAQTLELISQLSEMEVEKTVKVCELDSREKSTETNAIQKIEEQTEKNEETSEIVMVKTVTEGKVEKMIIDEDSCIPDQGTVFFGNQKDGQNSGVEEKKEVSEFNGEEQNSKTNDTDKATKNEIINKEVAAEPKITGVGEDIGKHIIEESIDMANSNESMKEAPKDCSQEGKIMKKHEEQVPKGPDTDLEVLEKSSTGANTERQKVVENSAVKDHSAPSIREESIIESYQEDEDSERLEAAGVGGETERTISEENRAVTDTCLLSVVGAMVKESSEEDEKVAEELKEEFTASEMGTSKNMEDTNTNADAFGVTEASREEMLQKEHSQKFAVYEEQVKEKELEEAENNNKRFEAASAKTLQKVEQEGEQLEDSSNLAPQEKSPITTETSWTSLQHVDVKDMKLEETPYLTDNAETMLKVEKQDADEGNQVIECENKAESSHTITGFQYEGIDTTTGKEITATKAPLDNRWEKNLQGYSTLGPKGQELDSIEESTEIKNETPKQEKNLEIPYLAKSTGEISIQKEEPWNSWKHEDVSKMGTDKIGMESSNEELHENDSVKENKLPESHPEKNISESKDANEILMEETTELTKLRENSRTETRKDEGKLLESSEEGDMDGEKPFDAVAKGVETSSSCTNIKKDVLDQECPIKNIEEIPAEGRIEGEKVENVGIKLEAGDQSHERNEGFDPTEKRALQESIEDVDPSQKLEGTYETVAEDQRHETLPQVKHKIKEDNRTVKDYITGSDEDQIAMQRLQEKEKDSMNPEDTGHKPEAELQAEKEDIHNEVTKTVILNEVARNGYDKAETSQNISKWSIEEESTAKGLHTVSIEDGTVNEVQDFALLSIEKCTKEIDNEVKKEKLDLKTAEFPNKRPEPSPITEASDGDIAQRQTSEDYVDISKHVPEVSEGISKEAEKSNDQLSIKSITAITEQMTSQPQKSELEGSKLVRESDISSEEKFQGTVETSSMDEEAKKVKLDQNSDSLIQPPSEGENTLKESQKLENIHASEVEEEMKRSLDEVAGSEYQAVKAITEAGSTANRPPLVEELEKNLQEPPVSDSEQERGSTTTNKKIRDEMPEEDDGEKNSIGHFTPEETEDVCLERKEHMELQQASKMGFQDIKKGSPNEQEEKGAKPEEALKPDSETPVSAAKDDSFVEREKNTELNEASDFVRTATSKEEENENLVSHKEESESRKLDIPFNEVSGEHNTDGQKVKTERDLLEKYDRVKTPEETLEEEANAFDAKLEAEISHFISEEQEIDSPSSIDKITTSKMKDAADEDLDASPADEVLEEEAVNQPQEVTQLVPDEPIHVINDTNEEHREGGIMEDLYPTDQVVPTNDSNAPSLIKASQEQAAEKRSQMTEDDERHTLDFAKQAIDEVNLPNGAMDGDPAKDEAAVKDISNKEHEKMDDYRCVQETNANEGGEAPMPEQENIMVFSSVEQATAERNFRDNPNEHDTTSNVVMENQNNYPPCFGEETVKSVHQEDDMGGKKDDEIATKLEVEDKSQALRAIEEQEDQINAANGTPNCEILNENVSEGLEKAGASAIIGKQIMEETRMVKDPSLVSTGEETYKESQHEVEKEGNMVNDTKIKRDLEDQSQGLEDEEDLKDKANEVQTIPVIQVSSGFEDAGSSKRIERQITEEEPLKDLYLAPIKKDTIRADIEEGKKNGEEVEKEVTKLDPRDQNHETSCKDDATENNMINEEVKSSDVVSVEQQLATTPSTNEAEAMTIKDEAEKDLDTSPTTNSPAEEAVNEPKEVRQLVPKEPIHGIHETNEDNKGAAEDKNVVEELNKAENPNDTSSNLVSNPGDIEEDLHPKYQEVPTSYAASSPTEASHEHVLEKEGHMTEDEERHSLVIVKQANHEVNLQTEETEGEPIKDEVQAEDILYKEGEKMNDYNNVQETTSGNEGGETPVQEQEDMVLFSFVEQETREQSIKASPMDHDTTSNLMIEEQSLLKEYVGEETVNKAHQDEIEAKKVDEIATELEAKDKCQVSVAIEDQMEKITEINDNPKYEILNEEVREGLEKAVTTENMEKQKMEENRTAKDPCLISLEGETYEENHHEDEKEGEMVNGVEIKQHLEDQSQEELAEEDLGDKANETNKTTNFQMSHDEVSLATEKGGSSEKIDKQITEDEAIKESFLAAIGEETTKKAHPEENKDEPEVEKEATNLDPKDQNHERSSKNGAREKHILNEEVKSFHFVPMDHDLETTASTVKRMDIVTMKEDTDVSSTTNPSAEEAPDGEAVNEAQEVPHHEPELIHESIITKEENIESATEAKIVAEEFIAVGKLKTTSSDLVSNPSNIGENLHPKDQEVPINKSNASSLTEVLQEKTPEKEGHMTKEERNSLVLIKHKTGETSLATGEMEGYPVNNEVPAQEILKKKAEKMNDTDKNITHGAGETPIPEQQQRAIFLSIEQAIADSSFRDSPEVPDTTGNLVFDKQSQVKTSLMHEVQIHENEKTEGTNLENSDSLNEKLSLLSDAPNKELSQKADSVMLPEVTEISQNTEKLEKAPHATTEESTQKKISTGQTDIPSVLQHSIRKSIWEDEDQRHGEALGTESKEKAVDYGEDSLMNDMAQELLDIDEVSLRDLPISTKETSHVVSSDTDSITSDVAEELLDVDEVSLRDLLISTKETSHMVAGNTDPTPPANNEELQNKEQQTIQGLKEKIMEEEIHEGHEEEENDHKKMHSGFDLPVMLEAPRHADVKPAHKKSHNILSGVGSKVMHSIAKLKKAIACNVPPAEATITEIRE